MATQQQSRASVRFIEAIAGLGDPTPEQLERKYEGLYDQLARTVLANEKRLSPFEIEAKVKEARVTDANTIRTGFTRDFAFKAGDSTTLPRPIAEAWAASCIVQIIPESAAKQ